MRTQEEIVARILAIQNDKNRFKDMFGFSQEVLLAALDLEHSRPFLSEQAKNVTSENYGLTPTEESTKKNALEYLKFAWGKAEEHRGLSADRSVRKMTEYCWLLGHDVKPIEEAEYAQYGCPKLAAVSRLLDAPLPESPELIRMMAGRLCTPSCEDGCGQ